MHCWPQLLFTSALAPQVVDKILGSKRNGVFIECGGHDGEEISNTLYHEMHRNYTGLLIEPNLKSYKKLLGKNRRVKSINSCLSRTHQPELVSFINADGISGIEDIPVDDAIDWWRKFVEIRGEKHVSKVICFPVSAIIWALGNPIIDYFSLDVEGSELPILRSIPFKKVTIKVFSIEVAHSNKSAIRQHMEDNGYILTHEFPPPPHTFDHVYMLRDTT